MSLTETDLFGTEDKVAKRAQDEEPCLFAGTGFRESDGEAEAD
nr:MAG TPA: hypothetical protein [Caudoviricetes sp.]